MPRLGDSVSDRVCRVPKPTNVWTVACSCPGSGECAISRRIGCSAGAAATGAALTAAHNIAAAQVAVPYEAILIFRSFVIRSLNVRR
jgi:hypothetical protein